MDTHDADPIIEQLIDLGETHELIRCMVLFGSRCNPGAPVDVFSDYDVVIYAEDPTAFGESDAWFEALGRVLIVFREESERAGHPAYTRLVLYEDGTKIDLGAQHVDEIRGYCAGTLPPHYDLGYRVLVDKDGLTESLPKPTYRAFIPSPPTKEEYLYAVNEFWFNSTYVAKYLWREDLMAAKFMLEQWLRHHDLRRMLEWSIQIERGWTWKPGAYGRNIRKSLRPEIYEELARTYAAGDFDALWSDLSRTASLFRKVAHEVGDHLGFMYPSSLDQRITAYHEAVRNLDRQTTAQEDLTRVLGGRVGGG